MDYNPRGDGNRGVLSRARYPASVSSLGARSGQVTSGRGLRGEFDAFVGHDSGLVRLWATKTLERQVVRQVVVLSMLESGQATGRCRSNAVPRLMWQHELISRFGRQHGYSEAPVQVKDSEQ